MRNTPTQTQMTCSISHLSLLHDSDPPTQRKKMWNMSFPEPWKKSSHSRINSKTLSLGLLVLQQLQQGLLLHLRKREKSPCPAFSKSRAPAAWAAAEKHSEEENIKMELRAYLQTTEVDSDADPLQWWRCYQANFPRVAKLAQQYLCIPAKSAPSERVFSTGGNIVTCHRAALKPDTVDRLVFLAQNL